MSTRKKLTLSLSAVALLALTFNLGSASTAGTPTSRGTTLLQVGCGEDPTQGGFGGPLTVSLGESTPLCEPPQHNLHPGVLLLPSGTLYNLRVSIDGQSNNGLPLDFPVTVTSAGTATQLACTINTAAQGTCTDLRHQFSVPSGSSILVTVTVPTGGVLFSASATLELNIVE